MERLTQIMARLHNLTRQLIAVENVGNSREAARLRVEIETLSRVLQASAIAARKGH